MLDILQPFQIAPGKLLLSCSNIKFHSRRALFELYIRKRMNFFELGNMLGIKNINFALNNAQARAFLGEINRMTRLGDVIFHPRRALISKRFDLICQRLHF